MALDAMKGYLQLVSGLGDLTRAKATEAADALLSLSSSLVSTPVASQVASLADEIMAAAATNRESLTALVRAEVESAVARALAAQGGELDRARVAVARLGRGVARDAAVASRDANRPHTVATDAQLGSPVSSPITRNEGSMATKKAAPAKKAVVKKAAPATSSTATKTATAKKAVAKKAGVTKKAVTKKAVTKKAVTKKAVANAVAAKTAPAKSARPASKTVVKKASPATKKTATKKTVTAKKSTAKKSTAKRTTASPSTAKRTTARKTAAKK